MIDARPEEQLDELIRRLQATGDVMVVATVKTFTVCGLAVGRGDVRNGGCARRQGQDNGLIVLAVDDRRVESRPGMASGIITDGLPAKPCAR